MLDSLNYFYLKLLKIDFVNYLYNFENIYKNKMLNWFYIWNSADSLIPK